MSSKDLALLNDMLDAARMAVSYVRNVTEDQFVLDTEKQDAVVYRIGVIGEAARGYNDVRIATVWTTVTNDLLQLIATLERCVAP